MAASNHVVINTNSRLGSQLAQAVASLRSAIYQLQTVSTIMAQCATDTTFADVEAQFGLTNNGTSGTTSTGYNVNYQVSAVVNDLTNSSVSPAIAQLLAQLG